jgi:hypothetical protein
VKKSISMLIIYFLFISSQVSAFESTFDSALNRHALKSPVLDAKEAYSRGNTELVDIELTEGFLLPGIKPERQESMRKLHRVRTLNRQALKNPKKVVNDQPMSQQDIRTLYKFKRYANRYNLTIMKLVKVEKLEQQRRYRY